MCPEWQKGQSLGSRQEQQEREVGVLLLRWRSGQWIADVRCRIWGKERAVWDAEREGWLSQEWEFSAR